MNAQQEYRQMGRLARLMDSSIRLPGGFRIGLDGIIGLIPGFGDVFGLLVSSYLIGKAATIGASRWVLVRMVGNVLLETLLGSVPIVGDVFDLAFRANNRNMRLLENQQFDAEVTHRRSVWWLLLLLLVLLLFCALMILLVSWLIGSLYQLLF